MVRTRQRGRAVLLVAVALATITCAYTWPLPAHLRSAVAHDRGDPLLVTWILWWSTQAMPLTAHWWNAPAFYPSSGVLAFSEHLLGLAPLTVPIILITGAPLLAYNIAFLGSYLFCGLGAYLLAHVLTRRPDASFVAAVAFAFAPYRLSHAHHIQLLSSYWMPVALAMLHRYVDEPRRKWALLFAAAWLMQALACGYYFFFLSVLVFVWIGWFALGRLTWRQLAFLISGWIGAACLLAPVLLGYQVIHDRYGFKRTPAEVAHYSAGLWSVFHASPDLLVWGRLDGAANEESQFFPGLTIVLVLAAGALYRRQRGGESRADVASPARRSALSFYLAAAGLMWLLALGPQPVRNVGLAGPYAALMVLPGFDSVRVPARMWMIAVLCLSTAAALSLARIESRRLRRLACGLAAVGFLLDGWPRTFAVVPAPGMQITHAQAVARLGLPLRGNETETMYGAIAQRRPVFNGYSGYEAPQHFALRDLLDHHDPRILDRLAAAGPIEIVVDAALDPEGVWKSYVEGHHGIRRVDVLPDWTSYDLPRSGAFAAEPITGTPLPVTSITASVNPADIGAVLDNDLITRWHTPRQVGGETIVVDLGSSHRVSAVVLSLGAYAAQYPRGLTVDTSFDGTAWSAAYAGGTALETYDAAVRSPREIPLTVPIRRDAVRFLRLRQTERDPAAGWTIVELRVIGATDPR